MPQNLVVVSGLSGSGKSIALKVLEDAGYYCVDNLPATLLLEVVDFLAAAGHERVAVSVDARSAALAALPEHFARLPANSRDPTERLPLSELSEEILGVTVRKVLIPVAAGRNLAVLLEAAVRSYILQLRGIDSAAEFLARQKRAMDAQG